MRVLGSLIALTILGLLVGCSAPTPPPATAVETKPEPKAPAQPAGDLSPQSLAERMDVPMYPGSDAPDGLTRPPAEDGYGGTRLELVLATADSVDKVTDFYKQKLKIEGFPQGKGFQLIGKSAKGNDLMIAIGPEGGRTMIRLKAIAYKKK